MVLDDHRPERTGKTARRRPESPADREPPARGAILARFRRGKHGCRVASGPRSDATRATPPFARAFAPPRGHDPVLPVALALQRPCLAGSGSGLQATPPFLAKNGPVVECLFHSPPRAGGRLQPAPRARLIPAGRLPGRAAAGPGGGRQSLRRRRSPRRGRGGGRATARERRSRPRSAREGDSRGPAGRRNSADVAGDVRTQVPITRRRRSTAFAAAARRTVVELGTEAPLQCGRRAARDYGGRLGPLAGPSG